MGIDQNSKTWIAAHVKAVVPPAVPIPDDLEQEGSCIKLVYGSTARLEFDCPVSFFALEKKNDDGTDKYEYYFYGFELKDPNVVSLDFWIAPAADGSKVWAKNGSNMVLHIEKSSQYIWLPNLDNSTDLSACSYKSIAEHDTHYFKSYRLICYGSETTMATLDLKSHPIRVNLQVNYNDGVRINYNSDPFVTKDKRTLDNYKFTKTIFPSVSSPPRPGNTEAPRNTKEAKFPNWAILVTVLGVIGLLAAIVISYRIIKNRRRSPAVDAPMTSTFPSKTSSVGSSTPSVKSSVVKSMAKSPSVKSLPVKSSKSSYSPKVVRANTI